MIVILSHSGEFVNTLGDFFLEPTGEAARIGLTGAVAKI